MMDKELRRELKEEADRAWEAYYRIRQRDDARDRELFNSIPADVDMITMLHGHAPMSIRTLRSRGHYFDVWTEDLKALAQQCYEARSWIRLTTKRPTSGAEYVLKIEVVPKPRG
jgi:hypothetical protein